MYNDFELEKAEDLFLRRCEKALDLDGCLVKSSTAVAGKSNERLFKCYARGCLGLEIDSRLWNFVCFSEGEPHFRVFDLEKPEEDGSAAAIPDKEALKVLFKAAEQYDVSILGQTNISRILSRGETLESLLVEYDLNVKT